MDAAGINNGTSWADAFIDLQAGLSAATPFDQIWVSKPCSLWKRTRKFRAPGVATAV